MLDPPKIHHLTADKENANYGPVAEKKGLTSFVHPDIEVRQPPISNQVTNLAGGRDVDMVIPITGYP